MDKNNLIKQLENQKEEEEEEEEKMILWLAYHRSSLL
jgi:hypothetical protein